MKIVIQYDYECPFLLAIFHAMSVTNNEVVLWKASKKNVYEMTQQLQPDLLIILDNWNIEHLKVIQNIPYIVYGVVDTLGKAKVMIPTFNDSVEGLADLVTYRSNTLGEEIETDFLISSNFQNQNPKTNMVMETIFQNTNFSLRCCGSSVVPSPYFVGICDVNNFLSIAKRAKIVLVHNNIEKYSLMYNKVYACHINDFSPDLYRLVDNNKLRNLEMKPIRKRVVSHQRNSIEIASRILNAAYFENESLQLLEKLRFLL